MRHLNPKPYIALLSLLCCFGFTGTINAQAKPIAPNFNLTTSPVYVTLATTPGKTVTTPIKVQNNAAEAVTLNVRIMKFSAYGDNGQAQLLTPKANDPSVTWVHLSTTKIIAQPQVMNTLTMTVTPSSAAAFGYYYAVVFTQDGAPDKPAANISTVGGSSAVLVLLDVQVPGEKRQLEVKSFTSKHKVYEFLPASFAVVTRNTGDVHAAPTGDVFISRSKKTDLATLPVNDASANVLPGSTRTFNVNWDDGFPAHTVKRIDGQVVNSKDGQPETQLSWATSKLNKFRFGHYYAHLLLVYNNGTQDVPVEAEVGFWVIPWKIILALLIILALVFLGLYVLIRRALHLGKKAVDKSKGGKL